MENNAIDGVKNAGNVFSVKQRGIFKGKTVSSHGGSFGKLHMPGKLLKAMKRLISALAMAEMIHTVFYKTPEQVRLEAIRQEILQQEDMLSEISY